MTNERFCENWRQLRVFLPDFSVGAFYAFNFSVTKTFIQSCPANPVFISHYMASDAEDRADTNIEMLPPQFRRQDTRHHSIRIRFRNTGNAEGRLQALIPQPCWYSSFLDYSLVNDLGGQRFCNLPQEDLAGRSRRARIVANTLFASTLFYLDTMRPHENGFLLETSANQQNQILLSPYQSVLHMVLNPPFLSEKVVGWGKL